MAIHADQIDTYGGATGLRDRSGLLSAIAQPAASFGGELLHSTTFEQAAAYLFHLAMNHPFIDGNKRTAIAAALVFLDVSGRKCVATDDELFELIHRVTGGEIAKDGLAEFFRDRTERRPD